MMQASPTRHEKSAEVIGISTLVDHNIAWLLGSDIFIKIRWRVLQECGQQPSLESFPLLDAPTL